MVRSNVKPKTIWLRKTEMDNGQLYLILKIRSNIHEILVDDSKGGQVTHYEYDEIEIRYQVPEGVSTNEDIKTLIANEATKINAKAAQEQSWKAISAQSVDDLRKVLS